MNNHAVFCCLTYQYHIIISMIGMIIKSMIAMQPIMDIHVIIWLVVSTPLKNMSSSVGDDEIPNMWKAIKFMFQTTNQYIHHEYHHF